MEKVLRSTPNFINQANAIINATVGLIQHLAGCYYCNKNSCLFFTKKRMLN